jgi:hypothetical protein
MTRPVARRLLVGLALGALLRAVLLPLPGTPDVETQKAWAFAGADDVTGLYGVGGTPPERGVIRWRHIEGTTSYPPVSLYQMAAVGVMYGALDSDFSDAGPFTVFVKAPGILAELALVLALFVWGRRFMGDAAVAWSMLALWLNPAVVLNGAALGYLDSQTAVPAVLALLAAGVGRPGLAGGLLAVGILTKPQALMVGPVVLMAVIWHTRERWRGAVTRFVVGGGLAAVIIVLPYVLRGASWNMVQALTRLAAHDMVSGYGLNVWWIVTWLVRSTYSAGTMGVVAAFTAPVEILGIARLEALGFPNPKPLGTVLVIGAIGWGLWRARRGLPLAGAAFLGGWSMLAYFTLGLQVHENHLYLAVPFLVLAGGLDARYRAACWSVSLATAFNMYIFYGIGNGMEPVALRGLTGVDLTVLASVVNVGVFIWLTKHWLGDGALFHRSDPNGVRATEDI